MAASPHQGGESRFPFSPAAGQPLYVRISDTLRRQIASGDFRPGDLLPSEAQLMAEFRVSRHTVRAALARLEQNGLITRVKGRGSVVNFVPPLATETQSVRAAKMGRDTIAFCAAEEDPFTMSLLWGIELEASRYHVSLLFASSRGDMTKQQGLLASFAESGLLGVIVMPVDVPPALMRESALSLDRWADSGLRLVSVDRYYPGSRVPTVTSDNFEGAYRAVSHLLQIGRQRVIAVSMDNTNTSSVAARLEGYRWAFKDAGLPANPEWEYTTFLRDDNDFLAFVDRVRPDGLFALNDSIAMRCMQLLRATGRTIPDDVAVVGFDDVPAAALLDVPLTTVRQDGQRMGMEAARLLLEATPPKGGQTTPVRIKIPVQLIVRASTAGPAGANQPEAG